MHPCSSLLLNALWTQCTQQYSTSLHALTTQCTQLNSMYIAHGSRLNAPDNTQLVSSTQPFNAHSTECSGHCTLAAQLLLNALSTQCTGQCSTSLNAHSSTQCTQLNSMHWPLHPCSSTIAALAALYSSRRQTALAHQSPIATAVRSRIELKS